MTIFQNLYYNETIKFIGNESIETERDTLASSIVTAIHPRLMQIKRNWFHITRSNTHVLKAKVVLLSAYLDDGEKQQKAETRAVCRGCPS